MYLTQATCAPQSPFLAVALQLFRQSGDKQRCRRMLLQCVSLETTSADADGTYV